MTRTFSLFCLSILFLFKTATAKEAYTITIKINGAKNQKFLLGYYYGDKQYIRDSAKCDATGKVVFKGKEPLDGGVYLLASDDKKLLFDFVVAEQEFSLETDTSDYIANMKVKGSVENTAFFDYSRYTSKRGREAMQIDKKYKEAKEKKDTVSERKYHDELLAIDKSIMDYRNKVMTETPNLLIAKIFRMMKEIVVPEPPLLPNGQKDSVFGYYYYRKAYLDNIDFTDDRLVRTPVFYSRIENYITKMIPQIPDSIVNAAFDLIDRSLKCKEMSKWLIYWITEHYETSQYMGMDAVFVKMVDKYYTNREVTYWVSDALRYKITDRANQLRNTLLGVRPPELNLPDSSMKYQSYYNIDADYTILLFWDPHCGRCKEEVPKLVDMYKEMNKTAVKTTHKKVEIYALGSTTDYEAWRKYINENKLPWINVHDPNHESNYHHDFDIYSTPVIYLLNKDKKIVAKRLTEEQVKEFIEKGIE